MKLKIGIDLVGVLVLRSCADALNEGRYAEALSVEGSAEMLQNWTAQSPAQQELCEFTLVTTGDPAGDLEKDRELVEGWLQYWDLRKYLNEVVVVRAKVEKAQACVERGISLMIDDSQEVVDVCDDTPGVDGILFETDSPVGHLKIGLMLAEAFPA